MAIKVFKMSYHIQFYILYMCMLLLESVRSS